MNRSLIPNLMTAGNLFCGVLAIVWVFQDAPERVAAAMGAALLLDFGDGFVARLLKAPSEMGKQLDSLADLVTFGVAPALMVASLLGFSSGLWPLAACIAVFSAWRLAKFNLDARQSDVFFGLPTPANAMLLLSVWLTAHWTPAHPLAELFSTPAALVVLIGLSCIAMVADIPLIALKFKGFEWGPNAFRYILLAGAALLLAGFQIAGIPFVILWYVVLSLVAHILFSRKKVTPR